MTMMTHDAKFALHDPATRAVRPAPEAGLCAFRGRPSLVQVEVATDDGLVRLGIRDDGVGGADPARGSGLVGLKDRVEATGGTLHVESHPGQGTLLLAELPIIAGEPPDSA
jgi:signal transduction histidine kinase